MTLLILVIPIPTSPIAGITDFLRAIWPGLLSYAASFAVLGVLWMSQHTQFHFIRHADQVLLWMTMLFLMLVAAVPFSATLIGRFGFSRWAVMFYGCHLTAIGVVHHLAWRYASHGNRLLDEHLDATTTRALNRISLVPILIYVIALALSLVNAYLGVIVYAVIPTVFIVHTLLPKRHGGGR